MTLKKRGLGRGLEALLVDVAAKEDRPSLHRGNPLPPDAVNSDELQDAPEIIIKMAEPEAIALIKTMQQENLNLLQETAALRELVDEFEALVRSL